MSFQINADNQKLEELIKEFLKYNNFSNTFECFEAEIKTKNVTGKLIKKNTESVEMETPKLYGFLTGENIREKKLEETLRDLQKQYLMILQAARAVFSNSVKMLEFLDNHKEVAKLIHFKKVFISLLK